MKRILVILLLVFVYCGYSQDADPGKYTIKNVNINTKNSDFGTAFFGKEKVVFASPSTKTMITRTTWEGNDQQFLDLFLASITDETGELENKRSVSGEVNNKYHQGIVAFTKDLTTVYFDANNISEKNKAIKDSTGVVNIQMYKADVLESGEWVNVVKLPFNNDQYSTGHPSLSIDDKKLYFISDRPGTLGKTDVFVVDIREDGTFSAPKNMGPRINTKEREMFPFISDDNFLYFSSDGHKDSKGELDVYASRIFDTTVSESINLGEPINSNKDDFAYIINDENHKGYFSSNRSGGKGDDDIYFFVADPPIRIDGKQAISGIVKDVDTGEIIPGATVSLIDENGNVVAEEKIPTELGEWEPFKNSDPEATNDEVTLEKGDPDKIKVTKRVDKENPELTEEVEFTVAIENNGKTAKKIKLDEILPEGYVYVSDDNNAIYDPETNTIDVSQLKRGEKVSLKIKAKVLPKEKGAFSFDAKSNTNYKVKVTAPGFLEEEVDVKTDNDTDIPPLEISVKMDPELRVVNDKIMINIKTIYFDFDKWNIRPDAAKELDKVIAVMKQHPSMIIEAGSHTDSRATEAYNQKLSERRAKATVDYIVAAGIDRNRITARGYGEMQLVNNCSSFVKCNRKQHQLNRRTEFVIVNDDKNIASQNANLESVKVDSRVNRTYVSLNESSTGSSVSSTNGVNSPINGINSEKITVLTGNYVKFNPIYFAYDSWSLSKTELMQIDQVIETLQQNLNLVVEAQVHTDSKNTEKHNQLLSDKRAKSIVSYMVSKGINASRITGKGFGEHRLVNHCKSFVKCSEKLRSLNRRTEFVVVSGNGVPEKDLSDDGKFIKTNPIYFDYDKSDIRKDAIFELNRVVSIMKKNPNMVIEAGSHTDSKNTDEYNQKLSERRANSVRQYLIAKGINEARIKSKGYGESQLLNGCKVYKNCTPEQHQQNRRTEFKVVN